MEANTLRELVSMLESSPGSALFAYYDQLESEDKVLRKGLMSFIRSRDRLLVVLRKRIYSY